MSSRLYFNDRSTRSQPADPQIGGSHIDLIASKILSLEDRMEGFASEASKRYRHLKDSVKRIKTDMVANKEERERDFESKVAELLQVERTFEETIETEKQVGQADAGAQA